MGLKDIMAGDVERIFLNEDDFAEDATFQPSRAATSFAVVITIDNPTPLVVSVSAGEEDRRLVSGLLSRAVVRAGIAAIETVTGARDPRQGDEITFPVGSAYAGVWVVDRAQADNGGGVQVDLAFARHLAIGAQGARETR